MKDNPPKRLLRNETPSLRFERSLAVGLAVLFCVLFVIADRGAEHATLSAALDAPTSIAPNWVAIFGILLLILVNGLFVAGETAVELLRPMHVKHVKEDTKQAARLQKLIDGKAMYVAGCSVGSQAMRLALVFAGFVLAQGIAVSLSDRGYPYDFGLILACAAVVAIPVAMVNLILGELVPKSFASLHPHRTSLRLFRFIVPASILFSPLSAIVVGVANVVTSRFGGRASFAIANQAEEEIKNLVETAQETGQIENDEKELLHSVFEFTDTVAREVMTPRVDLDAMPVSSDPAEVVRVIQESGHSRIPLYEDTDDQIVGVIHAKDLLMKMVEGGPAVELKQLMRPPLFVHENKNLHELLADMRTERNQLAVVQDEFGGTAGIVTIEDIVEELVGDIVDEYDDEEPEIVPIPSGYLIEGKTHLDDVNSGIGASFFSEEFDTIGGYIFGMFGRQPKEDEFIDLDGWRFTVVETDGRRVHRVRVERMSSEATLDNEPAEERLA